MDRETTSGEVLTNERQPTGFSEELRNHLGKFTACDISDALQALGWNSGGFLPGPSMWSPHRQEGESRIIGPVHVVEYASVSDPRPEVKPHYIDGVPPGSVLVILAPSDSSNAVYGGLMSARAQALGAAGTIVFGRIRDLEEHRKLNYPVWANDIGIASPKGVLKVVSAGENRSYQIPMPNGPHVLIRGGDIVLADLNGVVAFSPALAQQIVDWLDRRGDGDDRMMEALKGSMSFTEASQRFRGSR